MHATPAELEARLLGSELAEITALYEIDPWGDDREDVRAATIAAAVSALATGKFNLSGYLFTTLYRDGCRQAEMTDADHAEQHLAAFNSLNRRLPDIKAEKQ